jgi:hypothetical protein
MSDLSIIMLAGSLRPSPLRAELNEPVLRLPMRAEYRILDAWLDSLAKVDPGAEFRIVVNDLADIDTLNSLLAGPCRERARGRKIGVVAEPRAWRGTAGLVRDLVDKLPDNARVAVLEAGCLPLVDLSDALQALEDEMCGLIVAGKDREPAGISIFRRSALDRVSAVGYSDMKEQLIPALHQRGMRIGLLEKAASVQRIRDRRSYLHAIATLDVPAGAEEMVNGTIDPSARLLGRCVVERGAVIEAGAVVHESVLLRGARVEEGAMASRCVLGRGAVLEAGERLVERVLGAGANAGRRTRALAG